MSEFLLKCESLKHFRVEQDQDIVHYAKTLRHSVHIAAKFLHDFLDLILAAHFDLEVVSLVI